MNHQARKIPDCLTQAIMTSPRALLLLLQLHHRTRCLVISISFFASGIPITSTTCCFHDWFFLLWIEESHVALEFWLFCDRLLALHHACTCHWNLFKFMLGSCHCPWIFSVVM
jgi:hypothetical protein